MTFNRHRKNVEPGATAHRRYRHVRLIMLIAASICMTGHVLRADDPQPPVAGDNLLRNGNVVDLAEGHPVAWKPSTPDGAAVPTFSVTPIDAGHALTISSAIAHDDAWYSQWVELPGDDHVGFYRIQARVRKSDTDVKARITVFGARPVALRHYVDLALSGGAGDWVEASRTFCFGPARHTPAPKPKMQVALILSSPGRADFGDIRLARIQPRVTWINERVREEHYGPGNVILDIDGSHRVRLIPQAPSTRPEPTTSAAQKASGYVCFVPSNSAGVLPEYVPDTSEISADRLRFAARGESEFVTFCLRPLSDLGVVDLRLEDLTGPGRTRIKADRCTLYVPVNPTAEMIGYNARVPGARYQWISKWLRPTARCTARRGRNIQIYVDVAVPSEIPAGRYRGRVHLDPEHGSASTIPFSIEVLPISLERPMPWGFFRYGWRIDDDEGRARYLRGLREMRWAGMTQAAIIRQGNIAVRADGSVDLSGHDACVALYREAGFPDPPIIGMERLLPSICAALGVDLAFDNRGFARFREQDIPDEVRTFAATVVRNIRDHSVKAGWGPYAVHLVDEIAPGGKMVNARFLYPVWRKQAPDIRLHSGIYTFDWWRKFDSPLDINTVHYVHPCNNEPGNRRWRALARDMGTDTLFGIDFIGALNTFWEGRQISLTSAKGVDGVLCWTQWVDHDIKEYEKNYGLDPDDFDPYVFTYSYWKGGPWAVHLQNGTTMRSTAWFGIREGIDDSRYLNTARAWIERARSRKELAEDAQAASLRLEHAMTAVPWVAELRRPGSTWTSDSADKVRRVCADIAVHLQAAMAK